MATLEGVLLKCIVLISKSLASMKSPRNVEILRVCRAPEYPRSRVHKGVPLGPWERFPSFQRRSSRHLRFDS